MDKFTNYDDTAQPLSGDIDAFLKNFFRDNSALLFSRSFRRFVFGKKCYQFICICQIMATQ